MVQKLEHRSGAEMATDRGPESGNESGRAQRNSAETCGSEQLRTNDTSSTHANMIRERAPFVSRRTIRAATDMLWSVTLDLELRRPGEVPWMSVTFVMRRDLNERGHTYGTFNPRTFEIKLRHDLQPEEAAETVAHECRHLWQYINLRREQFRDKPYIEADCRWYEREAVRRFFDPEQYEPQRETIEKRSRVAA